MARTHCWKDKAEYCLEKFGSDSKEYIETFLDCGATCMLWSDHGGEHVFTPDDKIGITFLETDNGETVET